MARTCSVYVTDVTCMVARRLAVSLIVDSHTRSLAYIHKSHSAASTTFRPPSSSSSTTMPLLHTPCLGKVAALDFLLTWANVRDHCSKFVRRRIPRITFVFTYVSCFSVVALLRYPCICIVLRNFRIKRCRLFQYRFACEIAEFILPYCHLHVRPSLHSFDYTDTRILSITVPVKEFSKIDDRPLFSSIDHSNRLEHLGPWSSEERRNRADLIEVFKLCRGLAGVL